jgi:trehalose/maltose transport system substrate-binding protein
MRRWTRNVARVGVSAALVLGTVSACSSSGGTPTLNWYINPDSGGQATLAKECSAASGGKYKITTHILPTDASQQRQQLVTRLAAQDSGIDMMSLDPVFVAEFAEAGFLSDVPASYRADFTKDIVKPAVTASTWKNKLVVAPFWANTQLLWYRKSIAKAAGLDMTKPVTWTQLITAAAKARKTIGVQADLYEGYTVWINALVEGAGGKIVENPGAIAKNLKLGLNTPAGRAAANVIGSVARKGVGGPSLSTSQEGQSLAVFESPSTSAFMTIWPYVWAAMKADGVKFRDSDVGWTYYPETVAGKQSKPPFGGIEIGAGKYGTHKKQTWQAIQCIRNEKHQLEYFNSSGNPAANTQVYNDASIRKAYPMADTIRASLERAAPRPQTQYYGDLSTGLQESFSPPNSVNSGTPKKAQNFILSVLKGDKLL